MRRAARIDKNHNEIVKALRQVGCSVQSLATIGKGCPDAVIGWRGSNYLVEIKNGSKPPSQRKLTPDEQTWIVAWKGQVTVVGSIEEAFKAVGITT